MTMNQTTFGISPANRRDIDELQKRIDAFREGREDEDRFKHFRLTRGVYGQRQLGVQMFRTKIPFGKLTIAQLERIAEVSEKYSNGNLHLTTRQNIQLHFVKLTDSPKVWEELAAVDVTGREACGNTVRNMTGSPWAGIDPEEPFDISPYVHAAYEYFLRNPVCQDMGRKIKPAFSSSDKDSAYTYFHDFGFIPRIRFEEGTEKRGFKVMIGGGLGAQSLVAETVSDFMEEEKIIPFMEACLRVFDRYGEREKRMKARMKFLVQKLGVERFLELVEEERKALPHQVYPIDRAALPAPSLPADLSPAPKVPAQAKKYAQWLETNIFRQKQENYFAVQIRVPLGNLGAVHARVLCELVRQYAADDIRISVNQGLVLRFVKEEALPYVFEALDAIGLGEPGFNTLADITACPGTDTCALGVTNSTALALRLEELIRDEFPQLVGETGILIKISGCMNACGQHMAANIGFHGSSFKHGYKVVPAMQVVLGGGVDPEGRGYIAEKIVKAPTKRIPELVRRLLFDFEANKLEGEYYNRYVLRMGKMYFYELLKPLTSLDTLTDQEYQDWGQEYEYIQEIGVGECAGVTHDLVGLILQDAEEKVRLAGEAHLAQLWSDSLYHSYTAMVVGAKGLLLHEDIRCNTHQGILEDFQQHFVATGKLDFSGSFVEETLQINKVEPSEAFSAYYAENAKRFVALALAWRKAQSNGESDDKTVISSYYKA